MIDINQIQIPYIMGKSPKILRIIKKIRKIARNDLPVLIISESGTYKEILAKLIHMKSGRATGPFITANIDSTNKNIIEEELFGYEKKLSLDALKKKKGKLETANKGTLFINDISELDIKNQKRLIKFITDKEFKPINSTDLIKSNARLICATSKNLKDYVNKGNFLEELYNVFDKSCYIEIPPLRERKQDILFLAKNFLQDATEKFGTGFKRFSKDARHFLLNHNWPGNIRELENTIKRATLLSNGSIIRKKDLFLDDISSYSIREFLEEKLRRYLKSMTRLESGFLYETVLAEVEKSLISIVLNETKGNQLKASKILGINRNTLRSKIKDYKIHI